MSFQGDVRGIGLAELLQGLARGRKEGVLTLTSRGDQRSVLGMEDGKAWLMPDPEEEPDTWRVRARDGWADDPTFTMNAERLEPIVKAQRLETLYKLLDGGGVHFRFDPGTVPERVTKLEEEGHQSTEIHCVSIPIEFLLLEYARIADELELAGHPELVPSDFIACVHDPDELGSLPPRLVQEINGNSTVQEIADRLGWPVRQAQLGIISGLTKGGMRAAHPIEILRLALHELQRKQFSRAGARLSLWCRIGSPGPLAPEDAEALANEWLAGRLTSALRLMPMRYVRRLLRRLDMSLGSTSHSVVHWTEAARIRPTDRIARLRLAAMKLRDQGDAAELTSREMLDLARELREHGSPMRSGPALAIAAHLQPTGVPQRLELGMGLVQAGRVEEAGPWIITACTDMLAQGHADRIIGPLRALLEGDPRNREARELLTRAKRRSTRTKRIRRNTAIVATVGVLLGAGAFVKVKMEEERVDRIDGIRNMLSNPQSALAQLDVHFKEDTSLEIGDLRNELEDRLRAEETSLRTAWLDRYHAAQVEAQEGEVLTALAMVRELPRPPRLEMVTEAWPSKVDLLVSMPNRFRDDVIDLGRPTIMSPAQVSVEAKARETMNALQAAITEAEREDPGFVDFLSALAEVQALLDDREHARSVEQLEQERRQLLSENDRLLELAHQALDRHEFERALRHYDEILENDPSGKVRRVLRDEIAEARKKQRAVERARSAAAGGDHQTAHEVLKEAFDADVRVMLPWDVTTLPEGVRVSISREGDSAPVVREAPFTIEGTFADRWTMTFELEDFDTRVLLVEGPQDVSLTLSRTPEISIPASGRVDAVPAPLGDGSFGDYLICDRNGMVARVTWEGEILWRHDLQTVSGIARRPVPMPMRDDHLLFLTETGSVWLADPEDGHLEGPYDLEEPPVFGPIVVGNEVHAQLRSGRLARWTTSLRPTFEAAGVSEPLDESLRHGFRGQFEVARPSGGDSPNLSATLPDGRRVTIHVTEHLYEIRAEGREDTWFSIRKDGAWSFVAWEHPSTAEASPILWIADSLGLRAFLPPGTERDLAPRPEPKTSTTDADRND